MIFGAYSNELHEIILLKSWDIRGLLWADLLLKDLKWQPLQFSLSNLIRFYLEFDWICEQDYEKQHDCQWGEQSLRGNSLVSQRVVLLSAVMNIRIPWLS